MTPSELKSALEAIIYVADEPATVDQMAAVLGEEKHVVRAALDELVAGFAADERGVEIRAVAGGYRVYTKPQHHDLVRRFIKSLRPPLRLTMPALETLAVIAYKQPVTQPEIQEIRGVNCAGVIETLLEKRLITTAGRKQVIGRPILYRSSKEFLMRFGLGGVDELPSLKEFEALAREALGTDDGIVSEAPLDETAAAAGEEVPVEPGSESVSGTPPVALETPSVSVAPTAGVETPPGPEAEAALESGVETGHESALEAKLESALESAREVVGEALGAIPAFSDAAVHQETGEASGPAPLESAEPVGSASRAEAEERAKKATPGSQ
jgi:segregation and condensation protein B